MVKRGVARCNAGAMPPLIRSFPAHRRLATPAWVRRLASRAPAARDGVRGWWVAAVVLATVGVAGLVVGLRWQLAEPGPVAVDGSGGSDGLRSGEPALSRPAGTGAAPAGAAVPVAGEEPRPAEAALLHQRLADWHRQAGLLVPRCQWNGASLQWRCATPAHDQWNLQRAIAQDDWQEAERGGTLRWVSGRHWAELRCAAAGCELVVSAAP